MQIQLNQIVFAIVIVALLLLFGPERLVGFGHDLRKAWRDFVGTFKR